MDRGVRRVVMRYTDGSSLAIEPERAGGGLLSDAVEIVDLFDKGSASLEFGSVNEQGQSDWRKLNASANRAAGAFPGKVEPSREALC